MARRQDDLTEEEIRRRMRGERRRGSYGGVYGLTYWTGGFYLSPAQFGYTTAQEPVNGFGGGEMSTATAGAGDGGAAAGGAPA